MKKYKPLIWVVTELYSSNHKAQRQDEGLHGVWFRTNSPKQQYASDSPSAKKECFPFGLLQSHLCFPGYRKIVFHL